MRIDLNCDLGESFGAYSIGADEAIMPYITSANIACGAHAGDPLVMQRTVELSHAHGVAIGAHPGLPDLAGFGRRAMALAPGDAYALIVYQVGALMGFAAAAGARVRHVKPHGALYNMAAGRPDLADEIARAVHDIDDGLVLVGLAGSELVRAGSAAGLAVAREAFVDRGYHADGTLVARGNRGALIHDPEAAVRRALGIVMDQRVTTVDGAELTVEADTLCIHGDSETAPLIARAVHDALVDAGVAVLAFE